MTDTSSETRPPGASRRGPSARPPTAQVAKIVAAGLTATAVLGLTTAYGWSARFAPADELAAVPTPAPVATAAPTPAAPTPPAPTPAAPLAPGALAPVAALPAPIPLAVPVPPAAAQGAPVAQSAGS